MGAIWRGHKRYSLEYEDDRVWGGSNIRCGYNANSIRTLKSEIKKIRKEQVQYNPRNFVIYDVDGELEYNEAKGHLYTPAVYFEK